MSGFIFVPIVRVRNVGFLAIVRNVVCMNCRGANNSTLEISVERILDSREFDSGEATRMGVSCLSRRGFQKMIDFQLIAIKLV